MQPTISLKQCVRASDACLHNALLLFQGESLNKLRGTLIILFVTFVADPYELFIILIEVHEDNRLRLELQKVLAYSVLTNTFLVHYEKDG